MQMSMKVVHVFNPIILDSQLNSILKECSGLRKISLSFYKHCVISKQHILKFSNFNARNKAILELIHFDIQQAPVLSLRCAKYFVLFIDNYLRRCWVYPIKRKADVFRIFKIFKVWVERDSEKKIKCLRIDNGGEYTCEEFDKLLSTRKYQKIGWHILSQQNVVERMNRTLLKNCQDDQFWAKAIKIACYVINLSPSTVIDLKTPMEMWTSKPADYSRLHTFGSLVHETSKLDQKSKKCIF